jgi:putative oxygen-independent coproporphyrinogen III oxidase
LKASAPATSSAGLYLHVPFCARICPYCDFAVTTGSRARRTSFVEALAGEIALWEGSPFRFDTVYFGGGTPSALLPEDLSRLFAAARSHLDVLPDAWIFLEANPENATPEALAAWRALGVRTVSLGVQSFDAANLSFLGRRHGPEGARSAVEAARAAGLDTVSLDLIFGLPGQTPERWQEDLAEAVRLGPDHISCYQLTIHEGTPFGRQHERGTLQEMPEPEQAGLFALTHAFLEDAGYEGYEVSNFARGPEHRSRHNRKYWDHTPYLGLGPSAHSFDGRRRWWNERRLGDWQDRLARRERPVAGDEHLDAKDLALEALMLALRTRDGLDLARFQERHGCDLAGRNREVIDRLVAQGYLHPDPIRLLPTIQGLAVADALARALEIG